MSRPPNRPAKQGAGPGPQNTEARIEAFTADDLVRVERQRSWVRDHLEAGARQRYDTLDSKLRLLSTIIRSAWIARNEVQKLQCLDITFGDALVQQMGVEWVAVVERRGRVPALRDPQSGSMLYPRSAISQRLEQGQPVEVVDLFIAACDKIEEVRRRVTK